MGMEITIKGLSELIARLTGYCSMLLLLSGFVYFPRMEQTFADRV
jgi:hypothetical protein